MSSLAASEQRVLAPAGGKDLAVCLEHISVRYRVPHERIGTFREYAIRVLQRRVKNNEFWALQDVSLEVYRGEVLGIIGRNGAGKSTLLKVVARVLRPTRGRVWVRGRVAPLLESQAGFHPELTGRENIFLNGTLLGSTRRELDAKFPRIVDFAELHEFIDAPLRTYSSGMVARLGFAIATDVEPDVLIVDEVLSVGDEGFQRKSSRRMQELRDQGATILFVTHNLSVVQTMCTRAIWLDHGVVRAAGGRGQGVPGGPEGRGVTGLVEPSGGRLVGLFVSRGGAQGDGVSRGNGAPPVQALGRSLWPVESADASTSRSGSGILRRGVDLADAAPSVLRLPG